MHWIKEILKSHKIKYKRIIPVGKDPFSYTVLFCDLVKHKEPLPKTINDNYYEYKDLLANLTFMNKKIFKVSGNGYSTGLCLMLNF